MYDISNLNDEDLLTGYICCEIFRSCLFCPANPYTVDSEGVCHIKEAVEQRLKDNNYYGESDRDKGYRKMLDLAEAKIVKEVKDDALDDGNFLESVLWKKQSEKE